MNLVEKAVLLRLLIPSLQEIYPVFVQFLSATPIADHFRRLTNLQHKLEIFF